LLARSGGVRALDLASPRRESRELNIVDKASDNKIGRALKKTYLNRTAIGNG
jgi:hypothetical protein